MNLKMNRTVKVLIFLVTVILIVMMFPKGVSIESDIKVGSIWIQEDLIANFTFEILKDPEIYEQEKAKAAESVNPLFIKFDNIPQKSLDSLRSYNRRLTGLLDNDLRENAKSFDKTFLSPALYDIFLELRKTENSLVMSRQNTLSDAFRIARNAVNRIYRKGLIDVPLASIEMDTISIREGKFEKQIVKTNFLDRKAVEEEITEYVYNYFRDNDRVNNALTEYILNFAIPNVIFSRELTEAARQTVSDRVSKNLGIVNENERIVGKHNRITPEIKQKIDSYRLAKGEETGTMGRIMQTFGKSLHIIIILSIYIIYIYLFRKRIFYDNQKMLLICLVILLISSLAYLVQQLDVTAPVHLLVLVPVASILLTVIFDSRLGFYGTVVIALVAAGLRGNDYVLALIHIVAGAFSAYTVRDIKNRSQIFRSFVFILIAYLTGIVAFGLERFASLESMLIDSAFAASNALISPVLAYGLIIFFEKAFRITTDLTLLELSDFNTPLLKELARNAPGTFNHSLAIGSMVENAAEEINGDQLLARVGAYYHDIGKSVTPSYFVENQMSDANIHEEMEPLQSATEIIKHVNEGIELAKLHNIPQEIIDFIPMHHGTMVVYFFYKKAVELYGEERVKMNDFRYPGPKPQTKETALVMLADACESAVRAMTEPDEKKIENIVTNLVKIRVDDGQLDEAPVTLRDITRIKEAFINTLVSQHHKRIRYPKQDEMEKEQKK